MEGVCLQTNNDGAGPRPAKVLLAFAGDVLILLLLMALAELAWVLFAGMQLPQSLQKPTVELLLLISIVGPPLLWVMWRWSATRLATVDTFAIGLAWGVMAGVLAAAVSYPIAWLGEWMGSSMSASNEEYVEQLFATSSALAFFHLVVLAPVIEELLFRKFLFGRFAKAGLSALGIVATSALFALMHEPFPSDAQTGAGWLLLLLDYFLAGALFAGVYYKTGRLSAAMAAHATNNLIVCLFYWVPQ